MNYHTRTFQYTRAKHVEDLGNVDETRDVADERQGARSELNGGSGEVFLT